MSGDGSAVRQAEAAGSISRGRAIVETFPEQPPLKSGGSLGVPMDGSRDLERRCSERIKEIFVGRYFLSHSR